MEVMSCIAKAVRSSESGVRSQELSPHFFELLAQAGRPVVGLGIVGIASRDHVVAIARQRGAERYREVGIRPHELGGRGEAQADEIVQYEDLAVALRPCPDADG